MLDNLILKTDSYKLTHWEMYPPNTTGVFSYFESREGAKFAETQFFGLQYLLKRYLEGKVIRKYDIREAEAVVAAHIGDGRFNVEGWKHIVKEHGGKLPLRIKAVPEGTVVPVSNVLMTVENTDPACYFLTNYMETLLTHVWYSSTVATLSLFTKRMIAEWLDVTGCSDDGLKFMLHDFGYRGATSDEAAAIGGAGHLVNFMGTDTIAAMSLLHDFYDAEVSELAFSVPATEHSIMTAGGPKGERDIVDRLLGTYPGGIMSVVADSYNIYEFVNYVCEDHVKERILDRDGVFVVRPDSITNDHPTPEALTANIVETLWKTYGGVTTSTGHKTLDPHVRVLWGDGIDPEGINSILSVLAGKGFSAQNMVFGMGGGLLQKVNRDTQRFAFKSSAQRTGHQGTWRQIAKKPLDATKTSKSGRLKLVKVDGKYETISENVVVQGGKDVGPNLLEDVFLDGEIVREYTFNEVRKNAEV